MTTPPSLASHTFLAPMRADGYFPADLVERAAATLRDLCRQIEAARPADLAALYALTHAATERLNELAYEFEERGSEIETAAREALGQELALIAAAYGFPDADIEELIAPRDW